MAYLTGDKRRERRRQLYLSQRGRCFWCDRHIPLEAATIDHVVPVSKGGTNHAHNLVMACQPCNQKRGNADAPGRESSETLPV